MRWRRSRCNFFMTLEKRTVVEEIPPHIVNSINETLQSYPHIKEIIPQCHSRTILQFDQYKGEIPLYLKDEIAESNIYGVLQYSARSRRFSFQLSLLDSLLSKYPEYRDNLNFRSQLVDSFFSRLLEIEMYDFLKERGYSPDIEPLIMPENKNSTKADFKISVKGIDIFLELFTPRLPLKEALDFMRKSNTLELDGKPNAFFYEPTGDNNVINKLYEEYKHHFQKFEPQFHSPSLIILDKTYSIGLADIFEESNLKSIFEKFQFPNYFIGIYDRTNYHIDTISKVLREPKPCRFYINPKYVDSLSLIPALNKLFC